MNDPHTSSADRESGSDTPPAGKNWLEWSVFGASLLLVLGVMGLLAAEALHYRDRPAHIETETGVAELSGSRLRVPVRVTNRGDRVAENVQVEIVAGNGDAATFTIAFVPRGATCDGWVSFQPSTPPAGFVTRVVGFEAP